VIGGIVGGRDIALCTCSNLPERQGVDAASIITAAILKMDTIYFNDRWYLYLQGQFQLLSEGICKAQFLYGHLRRDSNS